jgi:hypothetical protein
MFVVHRRILGYSPRKDPVSRLGNRSALEWLIDHYQVEPITGPGGARVSDPDRLDDFPWNSHGKTALAQPLWSGLALELARGLERKPPDLLDD